MLGKFEDRVARVRLLRASMTRGVLQFGVFAAPCAVGRSGVRALKREGDGASPRGIWEIGPVFYRDDRVRRPRTLSPVLAIRKTMAWCDVAGDRNYNRLVQLPYPSIDEQLWRDDHLYDLCVVLRYNDTPRVQGLGSAIFMHLARPGFLPTAGCVALAKRDLYRLLEAEPAPVAVRFG